MSGVNVNFYLSQLQKQLYLADNKLQQNDYVKLIHEKTQVRPSFLFVGPATFILLFLVWGVGATFVCNLIGFAFPLYESYRTLAISQQSTSQQTHSLQAQWLTYWIIYGTFTLIESLTDFFLYWVPLYHLVKIAFLVWCFLPNTRGAEVIYLKVVEPILVRYEGKIDNAGREGKRAANRIIADVASEIAQAESKAADNPVQGEQ